MKKVLGMALLTGVALLGASAYANTSSYTYNMLICNKITNEASFTGKDLIGVVQFKSAGGAIGGIESTFDVDSSICIDNHDTGLNVSFYLVDKSYVNQIGGISMANNRNLSSTGLLTDTHFAKVNGEIGGFQEVEFGDGIEKITNYYTVVPTEAGYSLSFQNKELNDGKGVIEWDSKIWLDKSIEWLYSIGATQYNTPEAFGAQRSITREEASKFFAQVKQYWGGDPIQGGNYSCTFRDMHLADATLRSNIELACSLGIMKGGLGLFTPKAQLTREQALVVAMRMYTGKFQDETIRPWYKNYRDVATNAGVFIDGELDSTIDARMASRGRVALLLYKSHLSAHR